MLPKENRLNLSKSKDKGGSRIATDTLNIIYRRSDNKKGAVIVSKAVAKKAVDRNRIKRLILEVFKDKDIKGEFIFIAKKNIADLKKNDIDEIITKITKKLFP